MPDMKAKLTLDASAYRSELRSVGMETEAEARKLSSKVMPDMAAAASRVFASTRTPVENFQAQLKDLEQLYNKGAISLDTYGRAVTIAKVKLNELQRAESGIGAGGGGLGALGLRLSGAMAVIAGIRVGVQGIGVALAGARLNQAMMTGEAEKILAAQLKLDDAIGDMIGQVPLLGSAFRSAWSWASGREETEQAIANIGRIKTETENYEKLARQWARETELEKARLRGASESEMQRIRGGFAAEDRRTALQAARETERVAAQQVADQEERIRKLQERLASLDRQTGGGGAKGAVAVALRTKTQMDIAAGEAALEGMKKQHETAMAERVRLSKAAADAEATDRASADARAGQEKKDALDKETAAAKAAADKEAADREAAERAVTAFMDDETEARIRAVEREGDAAKAAAEKLGLDVADVERRKQEKIEDIRRQAREREEAERQRDLAKQQSLLDKELDAWRRQAAQKLSEAEQLRSRLDALERGRIAAEESWYDRRIRMQMEGRSPEARAAIAGSAAREYVRHAGTAGQMGDYEEQRRRLGRAMDYAQESGDRRLMEQVQNQIRKTFTLQKAATEQQLRENRSALDSLSKQLDGIQAKAAAMKVVLDTAEAEARLRGLGIAVGRPVTARAPASAGRAQGMAEGGIIGPMSPIRPMGSSDTVPAWLTPGEFVVNRDSTARHRGLLEALNKGWGYMPNAPRFASGGLVGPSTNVSTDNRRFNINLVAGQGADARALARQILTEIRRIEQRGG